jgi:uncharacterized protein YjbI with pentapeptide repeats
MKLKAPDAATAVAGSPINWFLGIVLAAFLTIISASAAADAQTNAGGLNPAEKWVVAQAGSGKVADLSTQFPLEMDRKLSAHFLEQLLMGELPGFKPHRSGVLISGAIFEEPIDLRNAHIPFEVYLGNCQFMGAVSLIHASFAGSIVFDDSTFKAAADFSSIKIGHDFSIRNAVFEGPVNFELADITRNFLAFRAKFQNKEKANFMRVKIGSLAVFSETVFEGMAQFLFADISFLLADEARFESKDEAADFTGIKADEAIFSKAVFEGLVQFRLAEIAKNFQADEAKFRNKDKGALFNDIKVGDGASFYDAVFAGPAVFKYADIAWLDLSSTFPPSVAPQLDMEGMNYKYIRAANKEPESHRALLRLADASAYRADVYRNLEEFFARQGYRGDADRAFIAGKRHERREALSRPAWIGSWLLDWLVGYGRRPWQAGIPCAVLVALGCVLFSPKKMEPQKPEDAPRAYSRFWYSLGLFLPFVDLQADKVWKPKADQIFLRNYMRVHILLGWILIPLVLAALTGLIK